MKSVHSIEDLREALVENVPNTVLAQATDFLRQATQENNEEAKQILLDIATRRGENKYDRRAAMQAIAWLASYPDPNLAPVFLHLLQDKWRQESVILGLYEMAQAGVISPADPRVVEPLMKLLSTDDSNTRESLMSTLSVLKAVEAIDLIAAYLSHPLKRLQIKAVITIGPLLGLTKRYDIADQIIPFLQDESLELRVTAALALKKNLPEKFSELDPTAYMGSPPYPLPERREG